jgi:DNA-binding LacI/PurR family transcriptional regulator
VSSEEVPVARPTRNAPTLESVAARAGVSRATAGRVLAGSPKVGEQARDAVLRAAAELSYVTNRAARSLMTRRSDSIAFVVAEPEDRFFSDPYFAAVLRGAHAAVAAHVTGGDHGDVADDHSAP